MPETTQAASIIYRGLLLIPPGLGQQQMLTNYLERMEQRLANQPIRLLGNKERLPLTVSIGPLSHTTSLDWAAEGQSFPATEYDAVGVITDRVRQAKTYLHTLPSNLAKVGCMVSDAWCHQPNLLLLTLEMFLLGLLAGDVRQGRALLYRERMPSPPVVSRRGRF